MGVAYRDEIGMGMGMGLRGGGSLLLLLLRRGVSRLSWSCCTCSTRGTSSSCCLGRRRGHVAVVCCASTTVLAPWGRGKSSRTSGGEARMEMSMRGRYLLRVDVVELGRAALAVWVEQKNPFMATYCETLGSNGFSITKSFDQAITDNSMLMLA